MIIQALLAEAGATGINREPVAVNARGIEAAADWATCGPPKTMSGMAAPELRLPAAQSGPASQVSNARDVTPE